MTGTFNPITVSTCSTITPTIILADGCRLSALMWYVPVTWAVYPTDVVYPPDAVYPPHPNRSRYS